MKQLEKKEKNSDLDETRGKLCIREPARVPGLQNIAKAYMCWDYVSNLALLPVIRHNQCWGQLQDAEVLLRWDTEGRHYHAESIPRRHWWGVGVTCCNSFLASHCCAVVCQVTMLKETQSSFILAEPNLYSQLIVRRGSVGTQKSDSNFPPSLFLFTNKREMELGTLLQGTHVYHRGY